MLNPSTHPELNTQKLDKKRPLLICDADEVIFDFMTNFERYLASLDLYFNWKSYALDGNILDGKKKPINNKEIKNIINNFFRLNTETMSLIKGAKECLQNLSMTYNIIVLSNIPFEFYENRALALKNNDINFSFYANRGFKGDTVKILSEKHTKKSWFIDDSPYQIKSVKSTKHDVNTILFINNSKLKKLLNHDKCWDHFSNDWKNNEKILLRR